MELQNKLDKNPQIQNVHVTATRKPMLHFLELLTLDGCRGMAERAPAISQYRFPAMRAW